MEPVEWITGISNAIKNVCGGGAVNELAHSKGCLPQRRILVQMFWEQGEMRESPGRKV